MKEHPILFSAPMVRAILEGRKTQTRRIIKTPIVLDMPSGNTWDLDDPERLSQWIENGNKPRFPCGKIGDRLWVRESWRIGAWDENEGAMAVDYVDGPDKRWRKLPSTQKGEEMFNRLWEQSSDECLRKGISPDAAGNYKWSAGQSPLRWRSSRFMPRWASRITLEITDVRAERLQDISKEDSIREGVEETSDCGIRCFVDYLGKGECNLPSESPRLSFRSLWKSIYGADSWNSDPWVWVISFRRIEIAMNPIRGKGV